MEKLEIDRYDNPYVQVVWEDTPENFTQERIKSVKQYFQKKYVTTNVNVITKVKPIDADVQQTVDVSFNIMDKNYQADMVRNYLKSKGNEKYTDQIFDMDKMVENRILSTSEEVAAFKKWQIRKIEFSNFLSFGDDQVLDFDKYNGITVIESSPSNFGGKCIRANSELEIEFDEKLVFELLGFLPDELK